jgi:apolipoprotein N-acyltransferase
VRIAAGALSGVLLFACFPALDWNWLVWVAVLPLVLAVVAERSLVRAFFLGYLAGAIFLGGSCYWFVYVMRRYGGMGMPLAVGVLILFLIVFSAFFGAYGLAEAWMARRSRSLALVAAPFLWVAMELARTYLITGFPWNLLGYAVQSAGLRQIASVTAVYGLSFLAVATSALAAAWMLEPRRAARAATMGAWAVALAGANLFLRPSTNLPAHRFEAYLVQPNIPLDEAKLDKWIPWKDSPEFRRLVSLSLAAACANQKVDTEPFPGGCVNSPGRAGSPPLLIWPENPAPFYFGRDVVFRSALETLAKYTGSYVISGTTTFGPSGKHPLNSAVVLDPQGRVALVYDKIHLVPFGEYVPWWAFPGLVGKITFEAGDFLPGTEYKVAKTPSGGIGVFICYESIFPQLVRRLVQNGAGVLVNISDDGWFGNSAAAAQHLNMARLRAVENGRYLLRATNDGITAIIDPRGEIVERLPRYEMRVLSGQFAYLAGSTFYTAHGDVFAWLAAAAAAGMMLASEIAARKKERM